MSLKKFTQYIENLKRLHGINKYRKQKFIISGSDPSALSQQSHYPDLFPLT